MKSVHRAIVEVDIREKSRHKTLGIDIALPEGGVYDRATEKGILVACPDGYDIPIGSEVYFHYDAISEDQDLYPDANVWKDGGKDYFCFNPEYIKLYRYNGVIYPHKCILLQHIVEEKGFGEYSYLEKDVLRAEIITSDVEGWDKGDIIKYMENADFEITADQTTYFYLTEFDWVFEKNGECVNGWNQIVQYNDFSVVNGVISKRPYTHEHFIYTKKYNAPEIRLLSHKYNMSNKEVMSKWPDRCFTGDKKKTNLEHVVVKGDFNGNTVLINNKMGSPKGGYIRSENIDVILN